MMAEAFGLHPVRGRIWTKVFLKIEKGKSFEFLYETNFIAEIKEDIGLSGADRC